MSNQLKVLVITYYWPPSGGPAVQRWLALTNLLGEHGIIPYVITVDENSANYPALDNTLVAQVSPKTRVIRTATAELFWIYKKYIGKGKAPSAGFANESNPGFLQLASRFVRGNFFIPDPRKSWNKSLLPVARELIKKEGINLIITAGPPHSTHLAGLKLKEEIGIKWIADFHDAWTDVWYYDKLMHTALAKSLDLRLERKVLEKADKIITVGNLLRKRLAGKSTGINEDKIEVISMGYDEKLFQQASRPPRDSFVITYTGTIEDSYEPGMFFQALKKITEANPEVPFKLRFVGLLSEGLKKEIALAGLAGILEVPGYVPHEKSIQYLLESTVLLMVSPKVKSEEIIIPGKIYEYMASRKPIINIGALGCNSAHIITDCEAGINIDRNMHSELYQYLQNLVNQWQINPDLDLKHNNLSYLKYSRTREAEVLIKLVKSEK